MSYILTGLRRKQSSRDDDELPSQMENFKHSNKYKDIAHIFVHGKGEKAHNFLEEFVQDTEWLEQGNYLLNDDNTYMKVSDKISVLKDVLNSIPKIFLLFRPAYGIQMSIRYIVKKLTGEKENTLISSVIAENLEDIAGYFVQLYQLQQEIFTGIFWVTLEQYDKKLVRQVVLSLLENHVLLRQDTAEILRVSPEQLARWGDSSVIIGNNTLEGCRTYSIKRGVTYEMDMLNIDRFCVACLQHFNDTEELLKHVLTHDKFICTECGIEMRSYRQLAAHSVTFCRATKLAKICPYCNNEKDGCKCGKIFEIVTKVTRNFAESIAKNKIIHNDMLPAVYHFISENAKADYKSGFEEAIKELSRGDKVPIQFEEVPMSSTIQDKLAPFLPTFQIDRGLITCKGLGTTVKWSKIKEGLNKHFDSYHELDLLLIKRMSELRIFCSFPLCNELFSIRHVLEQHATCVFSRDMRTEEFPIKFENINKYVRHCTEHIIDFSENSSYCCIYCDRRMETEDGMNMGYFLKHMAIHAESRKGQLENCNLECTSNELKSCKKLKVESDIDLLLHRILFHIKHPDTLKIYMLDKMYQETQKEKKKITTSCVKFSKGGNTAKYLNYDAILEESENEDKTTTDEEGDNQGNRKENTISISRSIKKLNEEDSEEEEDEDRNNGKKRGNSTENDQEFLCHNENHKKPVTFKSQIQLTKHIVEKHSCTYKGCGFYNMMEATLLKHYRIHLRDNLTDLCKVCGLLVKDLPEHMLEHPKCTSCRKPFENLQQLRVHEPSCQKIIYVPEEAEGNEEQTSARDTASLLIDDTDLESNFSSLIQKLLASSTLTEIEKETGQKIVAKYTSSNAIAKHRLRVDAISSRRNDSLLFELPEFNHADKPQLHKSLSALGDVKENEKFNPRIQTSTQHCVLNYEAFELILNKMASLILIGNLNEPLAVNLIQKFLAQPVIDAITSYHKRNWEQLSYRSILSTVQWLWIPIKLSVFEGLVLAYRHHSAEETYIEFSSKCYRHLKLVSRLKPIEERPRYIEGHLRKILKQNLPAKLLDTVLSKENLYSEFTSSELIDIYVSHVQNTTSDRYNTEKYNVFLAKTKPMPGALRSRRARGKQEEYNREKSINERRNESNKSGPRWSRNESKQKEKNKIGEIQANETQRPFVRRGSGDNTNNPTNRRTNKLPSEESKAKLKTLQKYAIDVSYPLCFLCLGKHLPHQCTEYKNVRISQKLCTSTENGKVIPKGFHETCRHSKGGRNITHGDDRNNRYPRESNTKVTLWKSRTN